MRLDKVIDLPCGARYMFDTLDLQSGASRRKLLGDKMMTSRNAIEKAYERLGAFMRVFTLSGPATERLRAKLVGLRDVSTTLVRLAGGAALDDIELFELKGLALLGGEVKASLTAAGINDPALPEVGEVVRLLDPDGLNLPTFYIYDSYSEELSALREQIKSEDDLQGELITRAMQLEDEVRIRLSGGLRKYAEALCDVQGKIADTDILLAKAMQAHTMNLFLPEISTDGRTIYEGLFNPQTANRLSKEGKSFQCVDIVFGGEPVTIIGANMGGKTVTLITLALAQYLFQFGFGIPAGKAVIDIKENVTLCIGEDPTIEGLSSFASEVVRIDSIIKSARSGHNDLALIDEPARTTNPVEGAALVKALVRQMARLPADLVITTHYDIGDVPGRKLRVRGIVDGVMDYTLLESDGDVPHEALTIARSIGADDGWMRDADELLEKGK